jgi:hypothetical protein
MDLPRRFAADTAVSLLSQASRKPTAAAGDALIFRG